MTNPILRRLLLGASSLVLLAQSGNAQSLVTTPGGYVKHDLFVGFNPVGLNLHESVITSGTFESEAGPELTDDQAAFDTLLTDANATYLLEILDGDQAGCVAEIIGYTEFAVTVDGPGLVAGTADYSIRVAKTLNDTFGVGAAAQLEGGTFPTTADEVWIPDGDDNYDQYFYHSGAQEFRSTALPFASPAKPVALFYPDGFFVQVKNTAKTLTIFGNVKTTPTVVAGNNGFNLVSVPSPVGESLDESAIEGWLASNTFPTNADEIWVPDGAGSYTQYFYSGVQWKDTALPFGADEGGQQLPSAIFIQRKGADTAGKFDLPAFFSSL